MPIIGVRLNDGSMLERDEVLDMAYAEGSVGGYPLGIIKLALDDREVKSPSASQLAGGAYRQSVLRKWVDYHVTLKGQFPALRGTLIHAALDALVAKDDNIISELPLAANLPKPNEDIFITGRIDVYYPDSYRLEDYKTCQRIPEHMPEHHLQQLAVYKWLLEWNHYPVEDAAINYLTWWSAQQVKKDEYGDVIEHPLLADEDAFVAWLLPVWRMLYYGYNDGIVPAISDCNTNLCKYCDLAWYCKNKPEGQFRI